MHLWFVFTTAEILTVGTTGQNIYTISATYASTTPKNE